MTMHDRSATIEDALGALREERCEHESLDIDALHATASEIRRRRAARRRALTPVFAIAFLALGATGAYAAMNPQWTAGIVRWAFGDARVLWRDAQETVVRVDVIESPLDSAHAQVMGLEQLRQGLTKEEQRSDLLLGLGMGPGGTVAEEEINGERRIVARDESGVITGWIVMGEDGSISAYGDSYIFSNMGHTAKLKRADINDDGVIDGLDLLRILAAFNTTGDCPFLKPCEAPEDIDRSGAVDAGDVREALELMLEQQEH